MTERRQPRVLGAQRTISEVLGTERCEKADIYRLIHNCVAGTGGSIPTLPELERVLAHLARPNSAYIRAGVDDVQVLASEILNNDTRVVMVFGEFSSNFGDVELYLISVVVQYNMSLEAITINGVDVSDDAVSILCEALSKSRVSFIDFSNTPLEGEAGHSLAALAHVNPYVRTIILDDTLIAEEVLDEIDVACQFNQSNFEANGGVVEPGGAAEVARLRQRMRNIVRAKHQKVIYCVPHVLGSCADGDMCLFSHSPITSGASDTSASHHECVADAFAAVGGLSRLPPPPKAGASWKSPEERGENTLRLNLNKHRHEKPFKKDDDIGIRLWLMPSMIVVVPLALVTVILCAGRLLKR